MSAVLVVGAISVVTTAMAWVLVRRGRSAVTGSAIAPGVAAGVMIWLALVEVLPDAARSLGGGWAVAAMGAGVLVVWGATHLAHRRTVLAGVAPVIGVALVLHDLPEGFAVGALLQGTGLVAALPVVVAVAAHNLPEKLAFVAPASQEGARMLPVLAAATLPEPLGAALAGFGAAALPGAASWALAAAGGMMLAVGVGTLPTVARRASAFRPFLGAGAAGALSMAALGLVLPG